jgi:histidyl-tRNA synthetase
MPVEPRLFNGTRDLLPAELLPRNDLLKTLVSVFERFGFAPVETPAMEYLDILLGKYGVEGEKLIYRLAYEEGKTLALRYDLTVPLARLVCMHPELPKPFKRYQMQPVWRADRPQPNQGRFREFYQCDVDTVGSASLVADAENIAVVHEGVLALGLRDFQVRVNNRKTLRGVVAWAGVAGREADALRVLDKLDKVGDEGVRAELSAAGFPSEAIDKLLRFSELRGAPSEVLAEAGKILAAEDSGRAGLAETREVLDHLDALGVDPGRIAVDLSLTRGLDYYTGPIYEVVLGGPEKFGSLGGGGRYDDLLEVFGGAKTPATGVSIGLSRVLAALLKMGLLESRESPVQALVMRMKDVPVAAALKIASELRSAGVATEIYYDEADRLKKQFQYAERKGVPLCVLPGADELARGEVNVKVLKTGVQETVALEDLAVKLRALLAGGAAGR